MALRRRYLQPGQDPRYPDGWAASIIEDRSITHAAGVKELRICDAIEPVSSTHRLVIDRSVAAQQDFQHQFTRIRRERNCLAHEHGLDALALAIRAWTHSLAQDPDQAKERARARSTTDQQLAALRDRMLKRLGLKPVRARWFRH